MRATRDGQIVQYNVIKNIFVGARDGDANHDDGIQVFLFNVGTGTVRNVALRGNIILERERDDLPLRNSLQGIGCFDGPLVNFTVEKNVVCTNHYHGISLYDAQGCTIQDNTCFSRWAAGRMRPWVMLGQKKKQAGGNTVRNNLAHSFNFRADAEVKTENNREVTEADFRAKLSELAAFINAKFGPIHPAAKRPRLEQGSCEMWVLEGSIGVPPVKLAQIGPKEPGFRQARRLSYSFRNCLGTVSTVIRLASFGFLQDDTVSLAGARASSRHSPSGMSKEQTSCELPWSIPQREPTGGFCPIACPWVSSIFRPLSSATRTLRWMYSTLGTGRRSPT
jgi:parallel beta-helix repeat protein